MTQELITLQFGPMACFVGSHFWNIQEASFRYADSTGATAAASNPGAEADHDALFRAGEDSRGRTTYTPRVVLCDRWSSLPTPTVDDVDAVDLDGAAAGEAAALSSRGLPVEVHPVQRNGSERHQFQRRAFAEIGTDDQGDVGEEMQYAESSFRAWNDCLGTRLHPRSLLRLSPLVAEAVGLQQQLEEDVESRLRLFAEECDRLQGFQLLSDAPDPTFGGSLTSWALAYLAEEFPKKARLFLPCLPHPDWLSVEASCRKSPPAYRLISWLTLVRSESLAGLIAPLSSPTSPIPEPWLSASPSASASSAPMSQYAATAAVASWLDTVTLPTRLRFGNQPDLGDVQRLLCQSGRRFCGSAARLYRPDGQPLDAAALSAPPPIGPFAAGPEHSSVACLSVGRCLPSSPRQQPAESAAIVERWLSDVRAPGAGHLARHIHLVSPPLTAKPPFPTGLLLPPDPALEPEVSGSNPAATASRLRRNAYQKIGCWAMLDNSSATADSLDSLTDAVEFSARSSGSVRNSISLINLELDELKEAVAAARDIADQYRPDKAL
ncbi:hypothetical protein BOX15_Mlig030292g1 [Macrostomum lignano]|uniref:Misat_Tub_SegII domain-containing protein n=1 Tax=Macrostomum lignano TaxID=282301 RepID=A0A267F6J2_9PLAT|nr:hypothetical protein BOX15_Mlig030292g1 [Macrostomum lignano]